MTAPSEKQRARAREIVEDLFMQPGPSCSVQSLRVRIAVALDAERYGALKEAAEAMCLYCREGLLFSPDDACHIGQSRRFRCDAVAIRALKSRPSDAARTGL
jgi:hypothetical protein